MKTTIRPALLATAAVLLSPPALTGQDRRNEQFYYPGSFNWTFLKKYPEGGRLFNAFDYGHAILYQRLYTQPDAPVSVLEGREFDFLTKDLLIRPPRFAVAEEAIEPDYAKLAWRAKQMFDWAHVLHRQIYDVYADDRLSDPARDSLVERLTDYYLSRREYAFAVVPKAMSLMDDQYYSQTFRRKYPKFNGLIWAYHWLQVGLYEPLLAGQAPSEKKAGVQATLARFWSMIQDPPNRFPRVMPMTSAVAPDFARRHPRAAIIFDNLHMMHDIISDILASDKVPRERKREVIYQALAEFRDGSRNVMSMDEWWNMGELMGGVALMGGPAGNALTPPPTVGTEAPAMRGMKHDAMGQDTTRREASAAAPPAAPEAPGGPEAVRALKALVAGLLKDPVRARAVLADRATHRAILDWIATLPEPRRTELRKRLEALAAGRPAPKAHEHQH